MQIPAENLFFFAPWHFLYQEFWATPEDKQDASASSRYDANKSKRIIHL